MGGDFNAQTGTFSDVAQIAEDTGISLPTDIDVNAVLNSADYSVSRYNQDAGQKSLYGKKIIFMCKNNNVVVFNGRVGKNMGIGRCTTFYNTTIDYVIGTCSIIKHVKKNESTRL